MTRIKDIHGILGRSRESIIRTMRQRGISEVRFCPTKEEYDREHAADERYRDYYDHLYEVCPSVVYFDKYNCGYEYQVLKVVLKEAAEPYFLLECHDDELGDDSFTDGDVYEMTWVYEMLEKHLGIDGQRRDPWEFDEQAFIEEFCPMAGGNDYLGWIGDIEKLLDGEAEPGDAASTGEYAGMSEEELRKELKRLMRIVLRQAVDEYIERYY